MEDAGRERKANREDVWLKVTYLGHKGIDEQKKNFNFHLRARHADTLYYIMCS